MKVILNTDIAELGEEGDILEVSAGYARNYLLPKKLVSMYNKANLSFFESRKNLIAKNKEEKRRQALSVKERIADTPLEFRMPAGDKGKLFGAVTAHMIIDALEARDITVERKKIDIPGHTLKYLGNYNITIHLYNDEEAILAVSVLKEGE